MRQLKNYKLNFFDLYCIFLIILSAISTLGLLLYYPPTFNHLIECFATFFVAPTAAKQTSFNFSAFVTALALLTAIYSATDPLYKFRAAVAPLPIVKLAVPVTLFLGFSTLFVDLIFSKEIKVPFFIADQAYVQFILGLFFLIFTVIWIYFSFFRPSKFSAHNAQRYFQYLHRNILRGSEKDLKFMANEILFSMENLVKFSPQKSPSLKNRKLKEVEKYAFNTLDLIGNKRLCKYIISESPTTVMELFFYVKEQKKYYLPINDFAVNISTEAILNTDSVLYHESDYDSGLIGDLKWFTQEVYGDYEFIDQLATSHKSPFDVSCDLDSKQLKIYCNVFLMFCDDYMKYIEKYNRVPHSYAFARALSKIDWASDDLYKIKDLSEGFYEQEARKRFSETGRFIGKLRNLASKRLKDVHFKLRDDSNRYEDIIHQICNLILEKIKDSNCIKDPGIAWQMHYSSLWAEIFTYTDDFNSFDKIFYFRLRRMIFNEIKNEPNYVSLGLLFYCLHIMGLEEPAEPTSKYFKFKALHKAILSWTKKNFLKIYKDYPVMVEESLVAGLTYDAKSKKLCKTYASSFGKPPYKQYLKL